MARNSCTSRFTPGVVLTRNEDHTLDVINAALEAEGCGYIAVEKNGKGGACVRLAHRPPTRDD